MTYTMNHLLENLGMVVVEELQEHDTQNSPRIEVNLLCTDLTDWDDVEVKTVYRVDNEEEMTRFAKLISVLHQRGSGADCNIPDHSVCCMHCDGCPYNMNQTTDDDTRDALMNLVTMPKWNSNNSIELYGVEVIYIDEDGCYYQIGDIDDPQFDESFPILLNNPNEH